MKKLIKTILILAIIGGIMYFTRPEEEKHIEKLTTEIVESARTEQNADEDHSLLEDLGNAIVGTISEAAVRVYVTSQLKVEDHYVVNVGKMYYDGEVRTVTIGAFGHVFCLVKAYDLLDEID